MLHSGGQNETWSPSGPSGYITPAIFGGSPMLRSGGQNQNCSQMGPVATWCMPSRRSSMLRSEGQNQKIPSSGPVAT